MHEQQKGVKCSLSNNMKRILIECAETAIESVGSSKDDGEGVLAMHAGNKFRTNATQRPFMVHHFGQLGLKACILLEGGRLKCFSGR